MAGASDKAKEEAPEGDDLEAIVAELSNILASKQGPRLMGRLKRALGDDAGALQELRQAIATFLARRFLDQSMREGLLAFLRTSLPVLRRAGLKDEEISRAKRIAATFQHGRRMVGAKTKSNAEKEIVEKILGGGAGQAENSGKASDDRIPVAVNPTTGERLEFRGGRWVPPK